VSEAPRPCVNRWRRTTRGDEGNSLVEFALVLPLFAILLMGMIDFGLVFGGFVSLRGGVEAGARLASVDNYNTGDCTGSGATAAQTEMVCAVAARVGSSVLGTTNQNVALGISIGGGAVGTDDVVVCEQVHLKSSTGLTSFILSGKTLTSESRIRLEQAPSFTSFTSGSVTYNGQTISGMTCP